MSSISAAWREAFGDVQPGYYVSSQRPLALRIHSLPEAKRYADTVAEYDELLNRHNAVAARVLGEGEPCLLIVGFWPPDDLAANRNHLPDLPGLLFVDIPDFPESPDPEAGQVLFKTAETVWRSGSFDKLIKEVADESAPIIVFANPRKRCTYTPYDGGAYLICESPQQVAELEKEFAEWLP